MGNKPNGAAQAEDIRALLRARNPLIWIVSREEARVEAFVFEAAAGAGYQAKSWDVAQGVALLPAGAPNRSLADPGAALAEIDGATREGSERCVWIMRDLPMWLTGLSGAAPCRQLRNLARRLPSVPRERAQAIIVLSPSGDIPPELANHCTVVDWSLPDRGEIAGILDATINNLPDELKATAAPNGTRDAAIDAAVGLSGEEAAACYARSLVQLRRIDPATVAKEKRRVIARLGALEWYDPLPGGLDAVGGLDVLKAWLMSRKTAYSAEARKYGLPAPRGAMLVGVPGCGKSLTAKAIATAWGVPLLRLDLAGLKSKYVGESEGTLRRCLQVIEAIGRCVVWIDELEKAMAGATQGGADGGVSSDQLGTLLSWMQERTGESFVIATCNDVSSLPPELMRKGRWDELWFIDLPTRVERLQILAAALRERGRSLDMLDANRITDIVTASEGFTGSEIAALVPDAMFAAFGDNAREITVDDLVREARTVTPLSKSNGEKITRLRAWAERARAATTPETDTARTSNARTLDL